MDTLSFSFVLLINFFSDSLVNPHPGSSVKDLSRQSRIQPKSQKKLPSIKPFNSIL